IMMMLQSCGASLFNEDGTGNIAGNEVLKECISTYAQMVTDGTLVEVTDWDQYISSLNSSTVASTFNGCWIMASIQAAEDQSGKWAITNMPKLDTAENATNYSNNGGSSWAISANCKNVDLAVDFLNATFAGSTALYDDVISKGALATWAPAGESDAYQVPVDFYGGDTVYAKIVDFATKTPSNNTGAFYYDARDAVGVALSNITQTGADIDSELQVAQETLDFSMGM
ncbi:MAG: extracellular solute-binding protein, partial [Lachnospiraceae bacterium]|nr:extracellular solute-binding protein [Lachnospiraceae bacterium]